MKKILVIMVSVAILGLLFAGCSEIANITTPGTTQEGFSYIAKGGPTEDEADEFPLFAGQSWEVGKVLVWDDGTQICVKYVLDPEVVAEGWGLTETHLAIGSSLADIPTNKPGNPQVGHFPYGNDELDGVAEDGPYCVYFGDIGEDGVDCGDTLVIAAHAAIEKTECEVLAEAPYGAFRVVDSLQGLRYDYTPVKAVRSVPENALEYETGHSENYFFSLGFHEDREGYLPLDNAWIIVEFEFPIQNGPGHDLQVVEDTWGLPYPYETADVWVSQDGISWEYLGEADNQNPINAYHTVTNFDLDVAGLEWAKFVKVQNTSIRSDFDSYFPGQAATLDGYDLNAVLALHNNEECVTYSESAWGAVSEGKIRFVDRGNWATYFNYEIDCPTCLGCPSILEKSDNIEVLATPPSNVSVNALVNDDKVLVWKEFEGPLPENLYYDLEEGIAARYYELGDIIPEPYIEAGTPVCIYYVHYDQIGDKYTSTYQPGGLNGFIEFSSDILGLVISGGVKGSFGNRNLMFAADDLIGNPGTIYPENDYDENDKSKVNYARGFEIYWSSNTDDAIFNDSIVDFNVWVAEAHDSFRVILPLAEVPCD